MHPCNTLCSCLLGYRNVLSEGGSDFCHPLVYTAVHTLKRALFITSLMFSCIVEIAEIPPFFVGYNLHGNKY